jgi:hypothetical protein
MPKDTNILFERTDKGSASLCLSDRFGAWEYPADDAGLSARFGNHDGLYATVLPDDPRAFLFGGVAHVVQRANKIGIQFEYEAGFFLGTPASLQKRCNIEARGRTAEFACPPATYAAIVHACSAFAHTLQLKWPLAEVFIADGCHFVDDALTVCVFVPLAGDVEAGFAWPSSEAGNNPAQLVIDLQKLDAALLQKAAYQWTSEDRAHASAEGWGLFSVLGDDPVPTFRIQRIDEDNEFDDDPSAYKFVTSNVNSVLHQKALRLHGVKLVDYRFRVAVDAATPVTAPDLIAMNNERAARAAAVVQAFKNAGSTDAEDVLSDLLCNLMHWANREGYDFDAALFRAHRNHDEETLDRD